MSLKLKATSLVFFVCFTASLAYAATRPGATPRGGIPGLDEIDVGIQRQMEKEKAAKKEPAKPIPPIKMVYIKGGCYKMGDFTGDGDDDERPGHEVCVGNLYMAETVVTQGLWEAVMGVPPVAKPVADMPVTNVSYFWAQKFIAKFNKAVKKRYRLPTEAEWEYAAREGGKDVRWSGTNDDSELGDFAWFVDNSDNAIQPVKKKKPNALGLYDMSGNVWQWVDDYFDFDYYQTSPKKNPLGPDMSLWRGLRGGAVNEEPSKLRTTYRYALEPATIRSNVGFRLAE